jgi:adenylylsulfate reductase subunit A
MANTHIEVRKYQTDVLIIGGGTAGCYAAALLGEKTDLKVLIAEKAGIMRSGCLAAGVNALNCYITDGHTPDDYVEYSRQDGEGIIRDDLVRSFAERVNDITHDLEKRGLVILKDENGNYAARGWRNIKINGENIKPILAKAALEPENVSVLEHVNITDLKISGRDGIKVTGAVGFSVRENVAFDIDAKAVLIATGGAAGLYRPNNPGFSRHKMWYPPFNTGAGYAMGIMSGAEMTTMEDRFVALRCKDTIAPTGTIAQGVNASQVNSNGEVYDDRYGRRTADRIYGTVQENRAGRGPCFLKTSGISKATEDDLYKAYLNMAPSQTLRWIESGQGPSSSDTEIEGTEPYVTGGHTAGGFWVDSGRRTTVKNLYAAGDVAGGAPQKYVTGALAEGEIAAESIINDLKVSDLRESETSADAIIKSYEAFLNNNDSFISIDEAEEAMQKIMDEYAGGIRNDYQYNEKGLSIAENKIRKLMEMLPSLKADDMFDLLHIFEIRDRLWVCLDLIYHMRARKETRWHIFGENASHPKRDRRYDLYVNSILRNGKIEIIFRPLVKSDSYSHTKATSIADPESVEPARGEAGEPEEALYPKEKSEAGEPEEALYPKEKSEAGDLKEDIKAGAMKGGRS